MPINSRQKGARGERELANIFCEKGYPAHRGQQFKGTSDSPDVVCPSLSKFLIECKLVENLNLHKAVEKAQSECAASQSPIVFHKKNRKQWLATMPIDTFFDLLQDLHLPVPFCPNCLVRKHVRIKTLDISSREGVAYRTCEKCNKAFGSVESLSALMKAGMTRGFFHLPDMHTHICDLTSPKGES